MSALIINKAKRFCILFLIFAVLSTIGFFGLLSFGKTHVDAVSPEFFERVSTVFGGLTGLWLALSVAAGVVWKAGARKAP
jgi:uncharacterized membrane protein